MKLAGLCIDMLDEAGEDLHQPSLERALRLGDAVPRRHAFRARRELGVGRNPAELLLTREHALAIRVPPVVEFPPVLVGPFPEDLVRAVPGAGRPVQEERLVRRECPMTPQPVDAALGEVFAQVVLARSAGAPPRWRSRPAGAPTAKSRRRGTRRSSRTRARSASGRTDPSPWSGRRRVVPLADRRRLVAVVAQDLGHRGRGPRDHSRVAIPVHRALRDRAVAHPLMVAPRQQCGARRRADRRRVKGVVADALPR